MSFLGRNLREVTQCSISKTHNFNTNLSQVNHFLENITRKYFHFCDLYLFFDQSNLTTSSLLNFNDLSFSNSPTNSRFVLKLETYFHSGNNGSFHVSTRKYSQCSLLIGIFLLGERKLKVFTALLVSRFGSPLKNEQDHFIFLVKSSSSSGLDVFMKNQRLSVIKYKFGIAINTNQSLSEKLTGKTICFFCKDGNAQFILMNLCEANSLEKLFPNFANNGNGHVMRVSAPLKYPFLYEIAQVDGEWVSKRGVYKFVIESLITHYNFTLSVFPSPGHGSGVEMKNGTWNGVMGQLLSGQADFGASTSPNPSRFPLTSFSTAMIYPFVSFTIGPPKITYSWKAIYWSFTHVLWLLIMASLTLMIFTFKIFQIVGKRDDLDDFPFYRHLVVNLSIALIGTGFPYPKTDVARIMLGVWLFAALIFNTLYVTKIVELLTFPIYEKQPKTFKELVQSSDFSWGFDTAGGNMFAHFKSSTNPVFQRIIEKKLPEKEAIDCYKTAINSKFACITWAGAANYIAYKNLSMIHGKSPLIFSDDITLSIPTGITFPRRTLYRLEFDKVIGRLRDSGQIDKWIEQDLEDVRRDKVHWQHEEKVFADDEGEDSGPVLLTLSNLMGMFGLYIVGQVSALALFIIELLRQFPIRIRYWL